MVSANFTPKDKMATGGNGSDNFIERTCSVCIRKGLTQEAVKYCFDCEDLNCLKCSETHNYFPALKGLKLKDLLECQCSERDVIETEPSVPNERCPNHEARHLVLYCEDHDEAICEICVAITHRSCKKLRSIEDEIGSLFEPITYNQTMDQLSVEKLELEVTRNATKKALYELRDQKELAAKSVRDYTADLVDELRKLEEESIHQINKEYEDTEGHLQNAIRDSERNIDEFNRSLIKLKLSNENKAQSFVKTKLAQKVIVKSKESKQLMDGLADRMIVTFRPEVKHKSYIQQIKSFGQICIEKEVRESKPALYTVYMQRNIDIKVSKDRRTCRIFGTCLTDCCDYLLLADSNNLNLKRMDVSTEEIKDHVSLTARPNAVCQTSTDEVAVSLSNKRIQFVSLGNEMTATRSLEMDHYCSGLAYHGGELFISNGSNIIYKHDINNTCIQKSESVFSTARHVSLSTNKDLIYVADMDKGLITLDNQLAYVSTFNDPDLIDVRAVCTDEKGTVFACGFKSPCIVQKREDSKTKSGSIESQLEHLSICFDSTQNRLYVTYDGCNSVRVFDLQSSV